MPFDSSSEGRYENDAPAGVYGFASCRERARERKHAGGRRRGVENFRDSITFWGSRAILGLQVKSIFKLL